MQIESLKRALAAVLLLLSTASCGSEDDLYPSRADALGDVESALERAAADDRLALVVLGADWCHDSEALARRLDESPLAELIAEHYEPVLVDIGYYEAGVDVVQRFGVPIYYATPTVLIIDPQTGQLVNEDDRHRWGRADSISMAESVGYFEAMAEREAPKAPPEVLLPYLQQLAAFEAAQAARVVDGFEVVGPLLRTLDETGKRPASFDERWRELSSFRNAIPKDLRRLRVQIDEMLAMGAQDFEIEFPDYPPQSWED